MHGQVDLFEAPRNRRERLAPMVAERLRRLAFVRHPGFAYSLTREGYREYVFGARSGPTCGLSGLAHELAHAVEFGPDAFEQRNRAGSFVFELPEIEVLGRLYPNPQTGQASERECRAFGIEWRLLEAMGLKVHAPAVLRHAKGTLAILPDWIAYHKKPEEVQALVLRARDAFTLGEITDRMVGWLDKTVERQRHGA